MSKIAEVLERLVALEAAIAKIVHTRRRVSRTEYARLKGVSVRTIARGKNKGGELVNGRWYFWIDEPAQPPRGTTDTAAAKAARDPRRHAPPKSPQTSLET
jgi:hypothetical protein